MIEVERQFQITLEQAGRLLRNAHGVITTQLNETYFDTPDFSFLKQDIWLRKRNERFELKARKAANQALAQLEIYTELSKEQEILEFLSIPTQGSLHGYVSRELVPIIVMKTERKSFDLPPFHIDIDFTDFGYIVCEIELHEELGTSVQSEKKIVELAQKLGLSLVPAQNKAKEYVVQHYPSLASELRKLHILPKNSV